jgi:hypothetical protein
MTHALTDRAALPSDCERHPNGRQARRRAPILLQESPRCEDFGWNFTGNPAETNDERYAMMIRLVL